MTGANDLDTVCKNEDPDRSGNKIIAVNKRISNAASQWVRPEPQFLTENIETSNGLIVVISVPPGIAKPYQDKDGNFWVKKGADNRKATAREELQRMFQSSGLVHADATPVANTSENDINLLYFAQIFQMQFGKPLEKAGVPVSRILANLDLCAPDGRLNIAGTLLFATEPHLRLPAFIIKAVSFPGESIDATNYLDSKDITGTIAQMFDEAVRFLRNNMRNRQAGQSVNSVGKPEIPPLVWEELVANALVHRNYFVSAPLRSGSSFFQTVSRSLAPVICLTA